MLRRWIYISSSAIPAGRRSIGIGALTEAAAARNASLSVTGMLVLAGPHFAQVLEGSQESIDALMLSIRRDPRHSDIRDIEDRAIPRRQFKEWVTAYNGNATYFTNIVSRALEESPANATTSLLRLFSALAAGRDS